MTDEDDDNIVGPNDDEIEQIGGIGRYLRFKGVNGKGVVRYMADTPRQHRYWEDMERVGRFKGRGHRYTRPSWGDMEQVGRFKGRGHRYTKPSWGNDEVSHPNKDNIVDPPDDDMERAATNVKTYGIVIDAGSSGSRLHVFSWIPNNVYATLSEDSVLKINPGVSSYAGSDGGYQKAGESLRGLIEHAKAIVPAHLHSKTSIYLQATAGMRLLDKKDQNGLLKGIRQELSKSPFSFDPKDARVIKGSEEALYAWLSVNHATGALLTASKSGSKTAGLAGVVELGGASSQIALQSHDFHAPRPGMSLIRPFGPNRDPFSLYAVSRLHYGLHEAYRKTLLYFHGTAWKETFPCGFHGDGSDSEAMEEFEGDYERCKVLVKNAFRLFELQDISDLRESRGALKPLQKKNTAIYYALDNFPKLMTIIATDSLNLPNDFDEREKIFHIHSLEQIVKSGEQLCKKNWTTVQELFSENAKDRKVKISKKVLRKSCFGIAYMEHLLDKIYHVRPTKERPLLAAHEINGMDAGWTMGTMIFEILTAAAGGSTSGPDT
jgi:apyrase